MSVLFDCTGVIKAKSRSLIISGEFSLLMRKIIVAQQKAGLGQDIETQYDCLKLHFTTII